MLHRDDFVLWLPGAFGGINFTLDVGHVVVAKILQSRVVDQCQAAVSSGGAMAERCRRLQQREWEALFDYCYQRAVGM